MVPNFPGYSIVVLRHFALFPLYESINFIFDSFDPLVKFANLLYSLEELYCLLMILYENGWIKPIFFYISKSSVAYKLLIFVRASLGSPDMASLSSY